MRTLFIFYYFMWTQYTSLVARKPFELLFFCSPRGRRLITHLYGVYVRRGRCVCVCVSRERSCQAELWGCSSIQPSNNNEPPTMLDRAHRLSALVAVAVVNVCRSLDACVVCVHIYIYVHLCSSTLCLTGSLFSVTSSTCIVVDADNRCYLLLSSGSSREADRGQVGPPLLPVTH